MASNSRVWVAAHHRVASVTPGFAGRVAIVGYRTTQLSQFDKSCGLTMCICQGLCTCWVDGWQQDVGGRKVL